MRKIFAISVFGNNPRYVIGAYKQVFLAKYFYPDFERVLFVDNPSLYKLDATVIAMPKGDGTFWRFLAGSSDAAVLFRDADSRITLREVAAVGDWLESGKRLHLIRDHDRHLNPHIPILAGNFGFRGPWPLKVTAKITQWMQEPYQYGRDQDFLREHVHGLFADQSMVHSIGEGWFGDSRKTLANQHEWVGQGWDEEDRPEYAPTEENFYDFDRLGLPESARFSQYPEDL